MIEFMGEHEVPVDEKGRIFVPIELRKELPPEAEATLVVVRGFDGCLEAYPKHIWWEEKARKLAALPQNERNARILIRSLLSQAGKVRLDRQGRATFPRKLLERAGIVDQMALIGYMNKIEIWNPQVWEKYRAASEPLLEEVAEQYKI